MNDIERRGGAIAMVILATSFGVGFVVFCIATLWAYIDPGAPFFNVRGISENTTQILTGWGAGIIGIVGTYIGYRAAAAKAEPNPPEEEPKEDKP